MTPALASEHAPTGSFVALFGAFRRHPSLVIAAFLSVGLVALAVSFAGELKSVLSIGSVVPAVFWAWGLSVRRTAIVAVVVTLWNATSGMTLHGDSFGEYIVEGGIAGNAAIAGIILVVSWLRGTRQALEREFSARLDAQRALAEFSVQSASILTSVDDGVVALDTSGRISSANPAAEGLFNRTAAQLMGADVLELVSLDEPRSQAEEEPPGDSVRELIAEASPSISRRGMIPRPGGGFTIVDCRINTLRNPVTEGNMGAVMTLRDITYQEQLERARDEFLAITSHELRTPLTAIQGAVKLATAGTEGKLPETVSNLLDIAIRNSDRVLNLVNQIIDLERMQLGHLDLDIEECSAREIADEVALELTTVAANAGTWIQVAGAGTVEFQGDRARLLQVLTNAVGNAIKFAPLGTPVTISFGQTASAVRFEVADQGRGIPAEQMEHVFEPFSQVAREDETIFGGTGLGLAIARGIIKEHGGRIWIESVEGKGTTVIFQLPLRHIA